MPTLILHDRERGLTRDRPRLNWPGNFVTFRAYNKVWFIPYARVDAHYVKFWPYQHPYSHPYGYVFAPVLEPRPRPLQAVTSPEAIYSPPDIPPPYSPAPPTGPAPPTTPRLPPIELPPPPPYGPPQIPTIPTIPIPTPPTRPDLPPGAAGVMGVIPIGSPDFMADTLSLDTTPRAVYPHSVKARTVALLAHPDNTADIKFASRTHNARSGTLAPGAGIVLEIDDPSKVLVWAESGTQKLTVAWELASYGG